MTTGDRPVTSGPGIKGGPTVDADSAEWLASLRGPQRQEATSQLFKFLLHVARNEIRRRNPGTTITGPEIDDLAHQAAADAVLLITRRIDQFRGESRFTTWACSFVVYEVSTKLGRHFWTRRRMAGDVPDWEQLPDRFGTLPSEAAESHELIDAVRAAVENCLTEKQREVFTAIVVQGIPLDALVIRMETNRNAVYKLMFDARQKLRRDLTARGLINPTEAQ